MDTKSLYDAAMEAETLYRDDDQATASDSILPWVILMLGNEEYLAEWFVDFTHELVAGANFERICSDMRRAAQDIAAVKTFSNESLITTYAVCLTGLLESIGRMTFENMRAECEKHVEANADEWTQAVIAYAGYVEEDQKEDYLYAQAKDKRLENKDG
jgi:hypothetical protein